ncbi:NADH:flavin oxidoreductase [Paenibacillus sp. FSL M8-0334]|uniref:NADH:flavin oxidoreductase n=1 Tax=Paenibacillus sp. FSL M8-0334 TaxID=2921623 RepID=UPI0030FB5042
MENNKEIQPAGSVESLFQPFRFGNVTLSNRIVMAPMTRSFSPGGIPGQNVADYYRRRAENDVGLIVTEGTFINHPAAGNDPNVPNIHDEDALNGWTKVVDEVHGAGGRIILQLWHVGMQRNVGDQPNPHVPPIGPSGLAVSGVKVTGPMTKSEIHTVIEAYAQAAFNAKRLGFDGIEIHGGHGYLIDQFFWKKTNQRTDDYGGNLVDRTRFAVEVIEACRRAVGTDFPISFRLSQWKQGDYTAKLVETPEQLADFLTPLVKAGVDFFHCSARRFWEPEFEHSSLTLAGWVKKLSGKPTITVGSIGLDQDLISSLFQGKETKNTNIQNLITRLEKGEFDLVAVGRALLADPAWPVKMRDKRMNEILPFSREVLKTLV